MIDFIDKEGKSGWFTLTVVAFWLAWPCGAAVVAFLVLSGRLSMWWHERSLALGRWSNLHGTNTRRPWAGFIPCPARADDKFQIFRTPEMVDHENREFRVYLERLRRARD